LLALRFQRWAENRHFKIALRNLLNYLVIERGIPFIEFVSYLLGTKAHAIMDDRLCFDEPWLRDYIKSSSGIVIDIGAGEGYFALKFARYAQRVYAYEPNPEAFRVLSQRAARWTNVVCENVCLGEKNGEVELFTIPFGWGFSSTEFQSQDSIRVRCTTLDGVETTGRVSLVKIDCEGAEVSILRGANLFISKHKPNLIIEAHGLRNMTAVKTQLESLHYHERILVEIPSPLDRLHRYYLFASPDPRSDLHSRKHLQNVSSS
jgi:FkbM family methyltransferase